MDLNDFLLGDGGDSMLDSLTAINAAWKRGITENYEMLERLQKRFFDRESQLQVERLKKQLSDEEIGSKRRAEILKEIERLQEESIKKAAAIQEEVDKKLFERASFLDKKRMQQKKLERMQEYKQSLDQEIALAEVLGQADEEQLARAEELRQKKEELLKQEKEALAIQQKLEKIEFKRSSAADRTAMKKEKANKAEQEYLEALRKRDLGEASDEDVKSARGTAIKAGWEASLQEGIQKLGDNLQNSINDSLNKIDYLR